MAKKNNEGKEFEKDFMNSKPLRVRMYRFKDGTGTWGGGDRCPKCKTPIEKKTTFQSRNICDFEIYSYPNLFYVDTKSMKGSSFKMVHYEMRNGEQKETSQKKQADDMTEAVKYKGIHAGFVVNFRESCETYYMSIQLYNECFEKLETKSINIKYFRQYAIRIPQEQKVKRWRYDIAHMIKQATECSIMRLDTP